MREPYRNWTSDCAQKQKNVRSIIFFLKVEVKIKGNGGLKINKGGKQMATIWILSSLQNSSAMF